MGTGLAEEQAASSPLQAGRNGSKGRGVFLFFFSSFFLRVFADGQASGVRLRT